MPTTTITPSMAVDLARAARDQDVDVSSLDDMLCLDETMAQLKAAVAEGDADVEAGRVEEAGVVFARLRTEFGY